MTEAEALAKIQDAVAKAMDDDVTVARGQHLTDDDILDSLDLISFLFELEELTGLKFPEEMVEENKLLDVNNLCAYIVAKA